MMAPLTYIFFDVKIFVSNVDEAIAYTTTYIVVNLMLQNYLYGAVRWPWVSELYEYVQGVFLAKAIVSVIASPRKPTFNVTAKGLTLDNDHLSELAWPFFAIYGTLFAGGLMASYRYVFEPGVSNLMLVVGLWNTFNMLVSGVALGVVAERKQADRHPRLVIDRIGRLLVDGVYFPVSIVNVSAGGCGVQALRDGPALPHLEKDRLLYLEVVPMGSIVQLECLPVIYCKTHQMDAAPVMGFQFPPLEPREYYVLADLMYGDSDALPRFLSSRRHHKNLLLGTAQFMCWGVLEPFRAFYFLFAQKGHGAADPVSEVPNVSTAWLHRLRSAGGLPEKAKAV